MSRDIDLFDARPYYPALVLIRIPIDADEEAPAQNAEFGTGFFAGSDGLVFTALHNLVDDADQALPWVWVCCYDSETQDWTDCRKVAIEPTLLDRETDAALLVVPGNTPKILTLSLDWQRGDDVAVIGFQPRRGTGFEPRWVSCMIPRNWPVNAQDFEDAESPGGRAREPYLGLQFTANAIYGNERVKRGFSGGPVVNLERGMPRVIAVQKAIMPADAEVYRTPAQQPSVQKLFVRFFEAPYVLSTPVQGMQPLFEQLPRSMQGVIDLYDPGKAALDVFQTLINEKTRGFVGRAFVFSAVDSFLNRKDQDRGYFVIEGEPGIGKTSLMAVLARQRGYVRHFNDELTGANRAEHFLENVCLQLIARYQPGRSYDSRTDFRDGGYLNRLLEDISQNLKAGERVVILVDGLDEAARPSEPGANLLFLPTRLPRGIYFVVTTRPLRDLRLHVEAPRLPFPIDRDSQQNLTDIRRYIKQAANREQLKARIRAAYHEAGSFAEAVEKFVEALVKKSEGNFMYLRYVLPELEGGDMGADELPQGLIGYYERHWQKIKVSDMDQWLQLRQPVICVLAAAQEPLSVRQVAALTRGLTTVQVATVLGTWRPFLRERRERGERLWQLYHKSFQDFLKQKDEVGEIDLKQTHQDFSSVLGEDWKAMKQELRGRERE